MLVIEEHLDGCCDFLRTTIVDRSEDPSRFGEDEMRYPGPARHEVFGHRDLLCVVPRDQSD
jgi:hypothetical protein